MLRLSHGAHRTRARSGLESTDNLTNLDLGTHLVSIPERQDEMSVASGVEARVPFLDNEVVEFARMLPLHFKLTFHERKRILKSVARRYLPDSVVDRSRSGFGVPLREWIRGQGTLREWVCDLPSDHLLTDFFGPRGVQRLLESHLARDADWSEFLWAAVNFVRWREAYRV